MTERFLLRSSIKSAAGPGSEGPGAQFWSVCCIECVASTPLLADSSGFDLIAHVEGSPTSKADVELTLSSDLD